MIVVLSILSFLVTAASFYYAALAFQMKGPLLSVSYAMASPEDRKDMKTKKEYRFAAISAMLFGFMFLLMGIGGISGQTWPIQAMNLVGIVLIIYACGYSMLARRDKE